jgi:hypothetical protein
MSTANNQGNTANVPGSSPYCSSTDYGLLESSLMALVVRAENAAAAAEASQAASLASELAAAASEAASAASAAAALASEQSATASETAAYNWAHYPVDQPVPEGDGGEFSSYHWASSASEASGKYAYRGSHDISAGEDLIIDYTSKLQSLELGSTGGEVTPAAVLFEQTAQDMVTIRLRGKSDTDFVTIDSSDVPGGCICNGYMRLKKDKMIEFQYFQIEDRWYEVARS